MDLLDKVLKFIQSPQCNKELSGCPILLHRLQDVSLLYPCAELRMHRLQNTWNELVFSKSGKDN